MGKKTEQQESEEQKDVVGEEQAATAEVCDAEEMSPEDQLRSELTQAQDEAKGHHERYLRTLADMENLRKRTQREKRNSPNLPTKILSKRSCRLSITWSVPWSMPQ